MKFVKEIVVRENAFGDEKFDKRGLGFKIIIVI